jgi:serine/threonine-protein kinase RsbT
MSPTGAAALTLGVADDADVSVVVLRVGEEAQRAGLDPADCSRARTAAAELATNILKYAGRGTLTVRRLEDGARRGLELHAEDRGPGIPDVEAALQDHYSTSGTLGLGLPGVRRLMDEFELRSAAGKGTSVRVRKWAS